MKELKINDEVKVKLPNNFTYLSGSEREMLFQYKDSTFLVHSDLFTSKKSYLLKTKSGTLFAHRGFVRSFLREWLTLVEEPTKPIEKEIKHFRVSFNKTGEGEVSFSVNSIAEVSDKLNECGIIDLKDFLITRTNIHGQDIVLANSLILKQTVKWGAK